MKSLAFGIGILFLVIVAATISTLASLVILMSRDDQDSLTTVTTSPSSSTTTNLKITSETTSNSTIINSTETTITTQAHLITTSTTSTSTTANTNIPNNTCTYPAFTDPQKRIVGGVAAITPIPWQAFIVVDNMYSCGGTILDDLTILCAAHCFPNLDSPSTIRVGSLMRWNGGQVSTTLYYSCNNM